MGAGARRRDLQRIHRLTFAQENQNMFDLFLNWLQDTDFFSYLRWSAYAYPALLAVHIVALVFLGGMVVLTDLRLLGAGMRNWKVSDLVNGLRAPKRFGFFFAAGSGALLFGAKAQQYSYNAHYLPWFWIKAALLALIAANYFIFRRAVYCGAAELDTSPRLLGKPRLAGGLSLLLWMGVVWVARGPATIKDIMHSMVDPSGDFLFHSVRTIADEQGVREIAPRTNAEWEDVRQRLIVLLQAPNLLEGRRAARPRDRSKNPQVESEPEDIQRLLDADRSTFMRRAQKLQDAASLSMKAVDAKDKGALLLGLEAIDKACESCHLRYWYPKDKRAQEAAKQDGIVE